MMERTRKAIATRAENTARKARIARLKNDLSTLGGMIIGHRAQMEALQSCFDLFEDELKRLMLGGKTHG